MKLVLYKLCLTPFLVAILLPAYVEENTGWAYDQSTKQAFYIFVFPMSVVDALGTEIEGYGDGTNGTTLTSDSGCGLDPSSCDVIGGFVSRDLDDEACGDAGGYYDNVNGQCDICVGWTYYDSNDETTLLINGSYSMDEDTEYYCIDGEVPTLKYYDASEGLVYAMTSDIDLGSFLNLAIYLYCPESIESSECDYINFIATEDNPLSNDTQIPTPDTFEIISVYPNPFNPSVSIQYSLGSLDRVNISIYDTVGRHIATAFDGVKEGGFHELIWAPDASISSGNYIVTIETTNNLLTRKVTYVK